MSSRVVMLLVLAACTAVPPQVQAQDDEGFRFVRIRFDSQWGGRGRNAPWAHDYPTAELNFYEALHRVTKISVEGPPLVRTLVDDKIFDYPLLYLCEPGYWEPTDEEVVRLRAYLERGGFIMFDDFRGQDEWFVLEQVMARVLPDTPFIELPSEHPLWSIFYDVDPVEAPSLVSGGGYRQLRDRYMALFDEAGRMVALAAHNQDLGDGWEWPNRNFENASTITFQMGVNFLMYVFTH